MWGKKMPSGRQFTGRQFIAAEFSKSWYDDKNIGENFHIIKNTSGRPEGKWNPRSPRLVKYWSIIFFYF